MSRLAHELSADDAAALRQAAVWDARLCSGSAGDDDRREWALWHAASERHRRAWQQVDGLRDQLQALPGGVSGQTLRAAARRRRVVLRGLLLMGGAGGAAWWVQRQVPWLDVTADLRTATAERLRRTLPDGSTLVLNARSAVDVVFTPRRRLLRLRAGEILVETAAAAASMPKWVVETPFGTVTALGTRFTVGIDGDGARVQVLDKAVRVAPAGGDRTQVLSAGEGLRFTRDGWDAPARIAGEPAAWVDGRLVAVDMPLAEWVAAFGRYRHGHIGCSPELADMKVSGVFPLDDAERALAVLGHAFPIRVVRRTRYWVSIQPRWRNGSAGA